MPLPLHEKKRDKRTTNNLGDSFYIPLRAKLLQERHWAYLQRRYHMGPRQLQVAKLTCCGLTNQEIAEELRISSGTVKSHLRSIFNKTRTKSRITVLLMFVNDVNKFFGENTITALPEAGKT